MNIAIDHTIVTLTKGWNCLQNLYLYVYRIGYRKFLHLFSIFFMNTFNMSIQIIFMDSYKCADVTFKLSLFPSMKYFHVLS